MATSSQHPISGGIMEVLTWTISIVALVVALGALTIAIRAARR